MTLKQLFVLSAQKKDNCYFIDGPQGEAQVQGLSCDSRQLAPPLQNGFVFVAICGHTVDGHQFVDEALQKGSIGLVLSHKFYQKNRTRFSTRFSTRFKGPVLACHNTSQTLAHMAHIFYNQASKNMFCAGITGTNGKTSVTYMAEHILNTLKQPACVVGTIDSHFKTHSIPNHNTTPNAIELHQQLQNFYQQGARAAMIEVSSHALSQHRADGLHLDAAVFTNLSQDHLDYHTHMQNYFKAKQRLFTKLLGAHSKSNTSQQSLAPRRPTAILNLDDPYSLKIFSAHKNLQKLQLITYGQQSSTLHDSQLQDLYAGFQQSYHLNFKVLSQNLEGVEFEVCFCKIPDQILAKGTVSCLFVGLHNIYNAVAALGVCMAAGHDFKKSLKTLSSFKGVPGRLQALHFSPKKYIFIDYAHTPDALEKVLNTLNKIKKARIITVFGCGGDRDKSKRPLMMRAALQGSDYIVLTSDNPRSEDPNSIIQECLKEVEEKAKNRICIQVDRKKALHQALSQAQAEDIVLIAGKGHEKYQIIGNKKIPFDDAQVATQFLKSQIF